MEAAAGSHILGEIEELSLEEVREVFLVLDTIFIPHR
jgi:hypothetical protein